MPDLAKLDPRSNPEVTRTKEYWEARTKEYAESGARALVFDVKHFDEYERRVLAWLDETVQSGWRVLDICCGYGRLAPAIVRKGASWTGVDFCEAMRDLWAKHDMTNQTFIVADCLKPLSLPERSFDLILGVQALRMLGMDEPTFAEAFRPFLKPDGIIAAMELTLFSWWHGNPWFSHRVQVQPYD
jgi:ubiquinone/menaquinone biosynthesis C-methylase UbiE